MFEQLSNSNKGLVFTIAGFILLLHSMGIIETGLNYLIALGALGLIVQGFIIGQFYEKFLSLIGKK